MSKLYASVSTDFDPASFEGVLVAAEDAADAAGFTEKGYDTVDYDRDSIFYAVEARQGVRFATNEDVHAAARAAGYEVFETHDEFQAAHPGAAYYDQDSALVLEEASATEMLLDAKIRQAVEAAGFQAVRDFIVVHNMQPELTLFWNPATFTAEGPLPMAENDGWDRQDAFRRLPATEEAGFAP